MATANIRVVGCWDDKVHVLFLMVLPRLYSSPSFVVPIFNPLSALIAKSRLYLASRSDWVMEPILM